MRQLQSIYSATALPSASVLNIALNTLNTRVGEYVTNLAALHVRVQKAIASAVRPWAGGARAVVRDDTEVLYDAALAELLAQAREDGRAITAQVIGGSATDGCVVTWRPGYGADEGDRQHAAGLFSGGSLQLTLPTDAGNTFSVEVVAELALAVELKLAARAITRELASADRTLAGDFAVARLRDLSHGAANTYTVETNKRSIIQSVTGAALSGMYESAVGFDSDPFTVGVAPLSSIRAPDLVRAVSAGYSRGPVPASKLPHSAGALKLVSGFAGAPAVQLIYPRAFDDARMAFERASSRAGARISEAMVKPLDGKTFKAATLVPYMPLTAKVA